RLAKTVPSAPIGSEAASAPLSKAEISLTIDVARVLLLTSLVFVHYGFFPNAPKGAVLGFDPHVHPVATFVKSFISLLALGLIPLLSAVSGWLFFAMKGPPWPQIWRRIRGRARSLYGLLVFWCALYLAVLCVIWQIDPHAPLWRDLVDVSTFSA